MFWHSAKAKSTLNYVAVSWRRTQSPDYYTLLLVCTGCDEIESDEKQTTQRSVSSSVEI